VEISKYINKQYHVTNSVFLEREAVYKNFDEFFSKTSEFYKDKQHKKIGLSALTKYKLPHKEKLIMETASLKWSTVFMNA